jgi:hypothetical protein
MKWVRTRKYRHIAAVKSLCVSQALFFNMQLLGRTLFTAADTVAMSSQHDAYVY